MNTLELKGTLIGALSQIESEATLYKILNFVQKTTKVETEDWWFSLPLSVRTEIEAAYEESENEELLIPHEEVSKKFEKWL
jgi:hypothetical protein